VIRVEFLSVMGLSLMPRSVLDAPGVVGFLMMQGFQRVEQITFDFSIVEEADITEVIVPNIDQLCSCWGSEPNGSENMPFIMLSLVLPAMVVVCPSLWTF
jgi:hypothetical protein